MMKQELVSIIVLNHNGQKYLSKCLTSLEKQNYPNFEIIFVDNASIDGSRELVKKKFPHIKIIHNKVGLGFAGGNNVGIKNAKGRYILLLSNDTWLEKDVLTKIVNFYQTHDYDVIGPREAGYYRKKGDFYITKIDPLGHHVFLEGLRYKKNTPFYLTGVCLFFKKKTYLETGGMDDDFFLYCEDVDWFWRLQLYDKKFGYINESVYVHHAGAGSSGEVVNVIKYPIFYYRNRNTIQMLLKNYKLITLMLILPLYIIQNIIEIFFFLLIFKPKISYSYIEGIAFNIKNLKKILKKRRVIQANRKHSDLYIMRNMYSGLGKLRHLLLFLKNSN